MKPHSNRVKSGATLFRVIRVLVVVLVTVGSVWLKRTEGDHQRVRLPGYEPDPEAAE